MGYNIKQSKIGNFIILGDDKIKALNSARGVFKDKKYWWFKFEDIDTLEQLLKEWGYDVIEYNNQDIMKVSFVGGKMGEDKKLFDVLAPFVKNGSFIEMRGEDGDMWRWIFKDGKCKEIMPKIIWEE